MPVLELTWQTALPLILAIAALLAVLVLRLPAAYFERRALLRARKLGMFIEPVRVDVADASIRREVLRVCKGVISAAGIVITFLPIPLTAQTRNWFFAGISMLMLGNSLFDSLIDRKARSAKLFKPQC